MKRLLFVATLLALCIGIGILWRFRIEPDLLVKRSRFDQMTRIEEGIIRFSTDKQRLPINLQEVVDAKYLPSVSSIYACALKYGTHSPPSISFENSDYILFSTTNETMIYLQPAEVARIAARYRFAHISTNRLFAVVRSDTRIE